MGFLMSLVFTKCKENSNLYYRFESEGLMILLLYVDDLFLAGEENLIDECKKKFFVEFEIKYFGMMHYFLGLEVWEFLEENFLNQGKYVVDILKRFRMLDCKAVNNPMVTNLNLLNDDSSDTINATL